MGRRLDDFLAGHDTLTAADLENRLTHQARHNDESLFALVAGFRAARGKLVASLEQLGPRTSSARPSTRACSSQ